MTDKNDQKPNLQVLKTPERTVNKREFADDVLDLANDESCGDIVGYAVVAIYENGYNTRIDIPEEMDDHLFYSYTKGMLKEGIEELYDDEEDYGE